MKNALNLKTIFLSISWRMAYALANSGANVNVQDNKGNTPLHLAYMRGYLEVGFKFIEVTGLVLGCMLY